MAEQEKAGGEAGKSLSPEGREAAISPEPVGEDTVRQQDARPWEALNRQEKGERRRTAAYLAWSAVFVVVIAVGAGAATAPMWLPHLKAIIPSSDPDPFDSARVTALTARVQALEEKVKARAPGAEISEMERERARLREQLNVAITRIESLEQSVGTVRRMATATANSKEVAQAQSSLDEFSRRLGDLEKEGTALKDLTRRLQELEKTEGGRLESARAGNRALAEAIEDLTRRLGAIEKSEMRAARGADESRAVILAVAQLREATRGAAPFLRELEAVKAVAGSDPEMARIVDELTPIATAGAPTLIALRESFDSAAEAIAHASARGDGWVGRTVDKISSLVTVRRTDGRADAGSVDAVLAKAESALKDGELHAATDALSGLSGEAAIAAEPWLRRARARLAVERALAALHVQAISRLAPAKG